MALSSAQMLDVRRFAGFQAPSTAAPFSAYNDIIYQSFGMVKMSLYLRLTTLDADMEQVLIAKFLVPLNDLEDDIVNVRCNLDTDIAAVWTRNKSEMADRRALFKIKRLEMCEFLGITPGCNLNAGGMRISRG